MKRCLYAYMFLVVTLLLIVGCSQDKQDYGTRFIDTADPIRQEIKDDALEALGCIKHSFNNGMKECLTVEQYKAYNKLKRLDRDGDLNDSEAVIYCYLKELYDAYRSYTFSEDPESVNEWELIIGNYLVALDRLIESAKVIN